MSASGSESLVVRESTLTPKAVLVALLKASPFLVIGLFVLASMHTLQVKDGQSIAYAFSYTISFMGLFVLIKQLYLTLPLNYREQRLYFIDKVRLTGCAASSILVKFDAHSIWKTYIVSGKTKTLIFRGYLDKPAITCISNLAVRLNLPIYQQEFLSKPKRVYWKK